MPTLMNRVLRRRSVRALIEGVVIIATFYLIPVRADRELGVRVVLTLLALGLLAVIVTRHVRRGTDPLARLLTLLLAAVATLALAFYTAAATPGQFVGLETRTDALYLTMATIGYGDIHATGQLARILVIVFQLVFPTTLMSTIARRLRRGDPAPTRRDTPGPTPWASANGS